MRIVTVLMRPDCDNGPRAAERIRQLAEALGIAVHVDEVLITSGEQAQAERFPGSPTVRVAGKDVEPGARELHSYAMT